MPRIRVTVQLELKPPGVWEASFWIDEPRPVKHAVRATSQADALRKLADVLDILNDSEKGAKYAQNLLLV
jgi:hypothetical protein